MKRCCPSGREKIDFAPLRQLAVGACFPRQPEDRPNVLHQSPADVPERNARDFFSGPVEQKNPAIEIRGEQSATHGVDDVFVECLQVLQFPALDFQFRALPAQALRQADSTNKPPP